MNPAPSEPPDQTRTRVERKKRPPADPEIGARAQRLTAIFCEEWKSLRGTGYMPVPRDAGAVKTLAKTWTDMERWRALVRAYLGKPMWGNKQACLWDLAMTPNGHDVQQAAPPRAAQPTQQDVQLSAAQRFMERRQTPQVQQQPLMIEKGVK